jgi:hypothetical protein
MRISNSTACFVVALVASAQTGSHAAFAPQHGRRDASSSNEAVSRGRHPRLFQSSVVDDSPKTKTKKNRQTSGSGSTATPPTDTPELYGTVVGDTKGAALLLEDVAISRGAAPLLRDVRWSVQPNERWGILGVNGSGT